MKIIRIAVALMLVCVIGLAVYTVLQDKHYAKKKAEWVKETAERDKRIEALEKTIGIEVTNATGWREKASQSAAESVRITNLLTQEKLAHARDLEKVKDMAPDTIVIETRYHLEVAPQEIILKSDGIRFTIHAGRKNIGKLKTLEFTLTTEVPRLNKLIETKDTENTDLNKSLTSAFKAINLYALDVGELKQQIKSDANILRECEKRIKRISFRDVAIGAGVVAVVVAVISFIK